MYPFPRANTAIYVAQMVQRGRNNAVLRLNCTVHNELWYATAIIASGAMLGPTKGGKSALWAKQISASPREMVQKASR